MTSASELQAMKKRGEMVAVLTAYDYPTGRLLDESGVDVVLVGDSLGMVVLGYPDTTLVTMSEMEHHTAAVARGVKRALVVADLPYRSYETPDAAVRNAHRLVEAGAAAVKLEGPRFPVVKAIVTAGIPVMGHLGMLPQNVRLEGGYKIKGRTPESAEALVADARGLEQAGAFAIVLELVTPPVAERISRELQIPTIGIGAGPDCDGQVLVVHDLLGLFPWFTPKFVQPEAQLSYDIRAAVGRYVGATKARRRA